MQNQAQNLDEDRVDRVSVDRLTIRTSAPEQSIWRDLPETKFRQHLINLEQRTNAVPVESQMFAPTSTQTHADSNGWPPVEIEQQFADDLAYIAAVHEGAQSVAAVCLIRQQEPVPLFRALFAAADTIAEPVKTMLRSICDLLQERSANASTDDNAIAEKILSMILGQHEAKILGRLRSRFWEKPEYLIRSHKKPLWQDFANVVHRAQHTYPGKRQRKVRQELEDHILALRSLYEQLEQSSATMLTGWLNSLITSTYTFCTSTSTKQFATDLSRQRATSQIAAALKCLHQLEKIGAYWRISLDLVRNLESFPLAFRNIHMEFLQPYEPVSTEIAYEPWAKSCHVHAEVQLLVTCDLAQQEQSRGEVNVLAAELRALGTSKYLCYLCYLFMKLHGVVRPRNTHGRLYDQWTVPDLEIFSAETRHRYRLILARMDALVCAQTLLEPSWRVEPMTSRQNLLFEPGVV